MKEAIEHAIAAQDWDRAAGLIEMVALERALTLAEPEGLKLIASGLSNPDIARKLFVATSTVKRHINNIYAKLSVHSRTQAVAKGKEIKLLSE